MIKEKIKPKTDWRQTVMAENAAQLAEALIKQLEQGTAPWRKSWGGGDLKPCNALTGKPYHGINAWRLMMIMYAKSDVTADKPGRIDNRFMTYKQALAMNRGYSLQKYDDDAAAIMEQLKQTGMTGTDLRRACSQELERHYPIHVKRGEKSVGMFEHWSRYLIRDRSRDETDDKTADARSEGDDDVREEKMHVSLCLDSTFHLFHASQIVGLPPLPEQEPLIEHEVIARGEQLLQNLQEEAGCIIYHKQSSRAYYDTKCDCIILPQPGQFEHISDYYSTALHEVAHWTGHESRLDRENLRQNHGMGSPEYAREELRAEMSALMMCMKLDLPFSPRANHEGYIQHYLDILRNDPQELRNITNDVDKIANFVLSYDPQIREEQLEEQAQREQEEAALKAEAAESRRMRSEMRKAAGKKTAAVQDQPSPTVSVQDESQHQPSPTVSVQDESPQPETKQSAKSKPSAKRVTYAALMNAPLAADSTVARVAQTAGLKLNDNGLVLAVDRMLQDLRGLIKFVPDCGGDLGTLCDQLRDIDEEKADFVFPSRTSEHKQEACYDDAHKAADLLNSLERNPQLLVSAGLAQTHAQSRQQGPGGRLKS